MDAASDELSAVAPEAAIGDPDGLRILSSLVAIAPTNLEDPVRERYEKPGYPRAADEIVRWARSFGLVTRRFDPLVDLPSDPEYRGIPRPNLIIDLDAAAPDRLLVLAHYDLVPVPEEERARWRSPPHSLTRRSDGRLYGRGSNDDLGSGVVASLLAMKRLALRQDVPRSVRLLVCCDEETGGLGGIEALKRHDAALPPGDPGRFIDGSVVLIPDGSPHTAAASSGLMFLDGTFARPASARDAVRFGSELVRLDEVARRWRSSYPSPDWPDHGAPEPVITGRATVTRFDVGDVPPVEGEVCLLLAHAENAAPNQIAEIVTLAFGGPERGRRDLLAFLEARIEAPYRLRSPAGATSLVIPPGTLSVQIEGTSAHAGYPHRGHNPVPMALNLIRLALDDGRLSDRGLGRVTFAVDVRLIPETPLSEARPLVLGRIERWIERELPGARIDAPPARSRGGYALPLDHPATVRLERLVREELGSAGVFGEYGGTDASTLSDLKTPSGAPLPALVFGSMDRAAHIHEAEESVDPRLIGRVSRTIERFASEP